MNSAKSTKSAKVEKLIVKQPAKKRKVKPKPSLKSPIDVYWSSVLADNTAIKKIKQCNSVKSGLNNVTQALENQAASILLNKQIESPIRYVFVDRFSANKIATEHLPMLCYMASPKEFKIKLVSFGNACEYQAVAIREKVEEFESYENVRIKWLEEVRYQSPVLILPTGNWVKKGASFVEEGDCKKEMNLRL